MVHACGADRSTVPGPGANVVWFPPGEKHWHGATAATGMTHIAIQERLDGNAVDWMRTLATSSTGSDLSQTARLGHAPLCLPNRRPLLVGVRGDCICDRFDERGRMPCPISGTIRASHWGWTLPTGFRRRVGDVTQSGHAFGLTFDVGLLPELRSSRQNSYRHQHIQHRSVEHRHRSIAATPRPGPRVHPQTPSAATATRAQTHERPSPT
jgi:hypothetical protein